MNLKTRAFDHLNQIIGPDRAHLLRGAWILTKIAIEGHDHRMDRLGHEVTDEELKKAIAPITAYLITNAYYADPGPVR